jgi:hypothetical protein
MPNDETTMKAAMNNGMAPRQSIVVVSGLPRSGTSMLMRVLEAGGLLPLTDEIRAADVDNPRGYYEFERVKRLPQGDSGWLDGAAGRAVKVISALLGYLPPGYNYNLIFMRRHIDEVLDSQRKMLERRGETAENDADMTQLLEKHVESVRDWLAVQPNFALLEVNYNEMLADPRPWVRRICDFLGGDLDAAAMELAVDASLYRNRRSNEG